MVITKASNLTPAAVRKPLNQRELPFKEVLLGRGKAAFCDRDHGCSPVRAP
jgi:hypothetical protein